jgi:hypothetical protein
MMIPMTPLAQAQRATYFAEMPPGSKADDVETLRLFTPLSGDRILPCHFAAPPLVEKSPVRSFRLENQTH